MALVGEIEWEPCLLEPRPDPELTRRLRKQHGRVMSAIDYFTPCPELSETVANLNGLVLTRVAVDSSLHDLIGVVVSQDNSCRYCYALQRAMMIALGYSDEKLHALSQEVLTGDLSPSTRAALEFARRLSRSNPLPTRADATRLEEAGFSDLQVKEIAGAAALHAFFNRISTIFALPPQPMEKFPERWHVRLLRPFFKKYVERLHRTVAVSPLADEEIQGPFSPLIRAMNGLPLARDLRALLDELLVDGALPARSKALVFAVVGRALGCAPSVEEGTRIALAGGLDAETVAEALDHLESERLSEAENLLLPLARETVWYEPAPIQRRAQEIRDRLAPEQLIEGIVAASAANMVCRLAAVVVDR